VPLVILFRALGCDNEKQMVNMVLNDQNDTAMQEVFRQSVEAEDSRRYQTQEDCLDFIAQLGGPIYQQSKPQRIQFAKEVLRTKLLPHVSVNAGDEFKKAYFTGYMTNRLLQAYLGRGPEDDRDYYGKKRLDMAGALLKQIFRSQFRQVVTEMQKLLEKDINNQKFIQSDSKKLQLDRYIKADTITRGLRSALATGNWGKDKDNNVQKTGVSQMLNRLTFASFLSHLRRVTTPLDKKGKASKPRQLHNSHWGMVCPAETPEGGSCGLVKNLTLMAQISIG
jgi:DNA-directed RNA polymerase II subunit RPB2